MIRRFVLLLAGQCLVNFSIYAADSGESELSTKQKVFIQQAMIEKLISSQEALMNRIAELETRLAAAEQQNAQLSTGLSQQSVKLSSVVNGGSLVLLKHSSKDCPAGYSRVAWLGSIHAGADGYDFSHGPQNWALCSRKF